MGKRHTGAVGIIAVRDVIKTSKLLTKLFNWKSLHGGEEFDILMNQDNIPTLLLHDFDAHEHKRFKGINRKSIGTGHSLYVFVDDLTKTYQAVKRRKLEIVEPLFLNENSRAREFTFKLQEGYQFSVCETDLWMYYGV